MIPLGASLFSLIIGAPQGVAILFLLANATGLPRWMDIFLTLLGAWIGWGIGYIEIHLFYKLLKKWRR